MYLPKHFAETDTAALHQLMRQHPLATVVTLGAGGLEANAIPLSLADTAGPFGTLRGHVARANPMWRDFSPDMEILAIFHGPQHYITPNCYPGKHEHGKAVPTWNYTVAHAYGQLRIIDDPDWLRQQLVQLTAEHEAGREQPWQMEDAPADYIDNMLRAVVGIEIVISRLIGKAKVSQNQPAANQQGVVAGLQREAAGSAMAALVAAGGLNKESNS